MAFDDDGTMSASVSGELFDCRQELVKLIACSNHALIRAERVTTDKLDLFIDRREGDELIIQLSDKSHQMNPLVQACWGGFHTIWKRTNYVR